jgi:serine/threonine protein kinase
MDETFESLYEKMMPPIGSGTFGNVYKCRRINDGAIFAVKEIKIKNYTTLHYALKEITAMEKTQDTPYIVKYV